MLNEHFLVIAGNGGQHDAEVTELTSQGVDLCRVQRIQHGRGRRTAELVRTIYGWSVRHGSGLNNFGIMRHSCPFEDAVQFGINWANRDPDNREFFVRRSAFSNMTEDDRRLIGA